MSTPLAGILQHLRAEPSRTWSIVITIFGDAVVPRGGSLWLGTLLGMAEGMGIQPGVVRTAMSRLAADAWLQRTRLGRNSHYSLTETGRASFTAAAQRIYGAAPQAWDGRLTLLLPGEEPGPGDVRATLAAAGFGSLAPAIWVAPASVPVPLDAARMILLPTRTDLAAGRQIVAKAWSLAKLAALYERFNGTFTPLWHAIQEGGALSDIESLVARILLIHEYRRVVLRDPLLPLVLLPGDWPGLAARDLAASLYQAVLPASEAWLDAFGRCPAGALPPPCMDLAHRFAPVCVTGNSCPAPKV